MDICQNCLTWRGAKEPLITHKTDTKYVSYCPSCGEEIEKPVKMTLDERRSYWNQLKVAEKRKPVDTKDKNEIRQLSGKKRR